MDETGGKGQYIPICDAIISKFANENNPQFEKSNEFYDFQVISQATRN